MSDPEVSAVQKLDAWFATLSTEEQQVITGIVRRAVTPAEELAKQDVSGFAPPPCRGIAANSPNLVRSLSGGLGVSAAVFLLPDPTVR